MCRKRLASAARQDCVEHRTSISARLDDWDRGHVGSRPHHSHRLGGFVGSVLAVQRAVLVRLAERLGGAHVLPLLRPESWSEFANNALRAGKSSRPIPTRQTFEHRGQATCICL